MLGDFIEFLRILEDALGFFKILEES